VKFVTHLPVEKNDSLRSVTTALIDVTQRYSSWLETGSATDNEAQIAGLN